jgi:hypothetical protein
MWPHNAQQAASVQSPEPHRPVLAYTQEPSDIAEQHRGTDVTHCRVMKQRGEVLAVCKHADMNLVIVRPYRESRRARAEPEGFDTTPPRAFVGPSD